LTTLQGRDWFEDGSLMQGKILMSQTLVVKKIESIKSIEDQILNDLNWLT